MASYIEITITGTGSAQRTALETYANTASPATTYTDLGSGSVQLTLDVSINANTRISQITALHGAILPIVGGDANGNIGTANSFIGSNNMVSGGGNININGTYNIVSRLSGTAANTTGHYNILRANTTNATVISGNTNLRQSSGSSATNSGSNAFTNGVTVPLTFVALTPPPDPSFINVFIHSANPHQWRVLKEYEATATHPTTVTEEGGWNMRLVQQLAFNDGPTDATTRVAQLAELHAKLNEVLAAGRLNDPRIPINALGRTHENHRVPPAPVPNAPGNIGSGNAGTGNIGHDNTGSFNVGDVNTGNTNIGNGHSGSFNAGYSCLGNFNVGSGILGSYNVGWAPGNTSFSYTGGFTQYVTLDAVPDHGHGGGLQEWLDKQAVANTPAPCYLRFDESA